MNLTHGRTVPWKFRAFWSALTLPIAASVATQIGWNSTNATLAISPEDLAICANTTVDAPPRCWNVLDVSGYLKTWMQENEVKCAEPVYDGLGFAACFQRQHSILNHNCSNIDFKGCPEPISPKSPNDTVQDFRNYYVLYSIYSISHWYNTLWAATTDGTLRASLRVERILDILEPSLPASTSLGVMLSALSAGVSYLSLSASDEIAKTLANSIAQAPGLIKAILPSSDRLDGELHQIADLKNSLGIIMEAFQSGLADSLYFLMSNFTAYQLLAANGSFIAQQPSLNTATTDIARVLKTYVVSQALQASNVVITRTAYGLSGNHYPWEEAVHYGPRPFGDGAPWLAPVSPIHMDINAFTVSHSKIKTLNASATGSIHVKYGNHINCPNGQDEHGLCDNWWIDPISNISYSLLQLDKLEKSYAGKLKQLFGEGLTSGEDLFGGAEKCRLSAAMHELSRNVSKHGFPFTALHPKFAVTSEEVEHTCYSNLKVCNWNLFQKKFLEDGTEFVTGHGCVFAWPNICVNGQGFDSNHTFTGIASVSFDGFNLKVIEQLQTNYQLTLGESWSNIPQYEQLGFNTLYDVRNVPAEKLSSQVSDLRKKCKEWPGGNERDFVRPAWGAEEKYPIRCDKLSLGANCCHILPASYLGPALHSVDSFCVPGGKD